MTFRFQTPFSTIALVTLNALAITATQASNPPVDKENLKSFLEKFDQNPSAAMGDLSQPLLKKDVPGFNGQTAKNPWEPGDISDRNFVTKKEKVRKLIRKEISHLNGNTSIEPPEGRAPFQENDLVEDLVDVPPKDMLRTLKKMEENKLTEAELQGSQIPWSDDYWPIYRGILGTRYEVQNPFQIAFQPWSIYRDAIQENPMDIILGTNNASQIDQLSPSEKFDLLIGGEKENSKDKKDDLYNIQGTLTRSMWNETLEGRDENGTVETWMGICHGWAQAAYMLPRPIRPITLESPNGLKLKFYPSDLKALGSLLWSKAKTKTKFIGGRCNTKNPETDRNGRVKNQDCFDTNPGTWHMAVVNQLGVAKRSFVMDATYDYEVWNQPVVSYSYTYFNPQTLKPVNSLKDATVKIANFKRDKFSKYRETRNSRLRNWLEKFMGSKSDATIDSVVGVAMSVTYISETVPAHNETDSPELDARKTVEYQYDLELNPKGEIIGGEWYTNLHPDFLWTPVRNQNLSSEGDLLLKKPWNGKDQLPEQWQNVAQKTAEYGIPQSKIVRTLFDRASQK